nr:hypothetical protein [Pandoravirus massiliensis]
MRSFFNLLLKSALPCKSTARHTTQSPKTALARSAVCLSLFFFSKTKKRDLNKKGLVDKEGVVRQPGRAAAFRKKEQTDKERLLCSSPWINTESAASAWSS